MRTRLTTLYLMILLEANFLFAYTVKIDELYYNLDYEHVTAEVTYESYCVDWVQNANITIPADIVHDGINYKVSSIGANAFRNCHISSITIPNTITKIGFSAFENCSNLKAITIPNSVTHIGGYAFHACSNLVSVTLPNSVIELGDAIFYECSSLSSITLPEYISEIPYCSFSKCVGLISIIIPDNVEFIGAEAFSFCDIKSITLSKKLRIIGGSAFWSCQKLSSIIIPQNVKLVKKHAFYNCVNLKEVYYPNHLDLSLAEFPSNTKLISMNNQPAGNLQLQNDISVDINIPISSVRNTNSIVLIIANERYDNMPHVPYALNDGNIFKEYCLKTLGIPEENIIYQSNATLNGIRQKIDLLQKKAHARANARKETHIIVYYTGHGVPDINTRGAYLMPIDGYEENISTGYKLDDLYQQLGKLPAKSITVFLDACFSGVNRNDEALAQNKGARLVAKSGMPVGNMVVFAASQGNQTAFVNDKEQHGLFTYYLLKKLQDSKGDVTLDVLANYLTSEVNLKSLDLHEKEQIPSIIVSPQVQNQWQNWKLK